jgi:hypothetical protein
MPSARRDILLLVRAQSPYGPARCCSSLHRAVKSPRADACGSPSSVGRPDPLDVGSSTVQALLGRKIQNGHRVACEFPVDEVVSTRRATSNRFEARTKRDEELVVLIITGVPSLRRIFRLPECGQCAPVTKCGMYSGTSSRRSRLAGYLPESDLPLAPPRHGLGQGALTTLSTASLDSVRQSSSPQRPQCQRTATCWRCFRWSMSIVSRADRSPTFAYMTPN